MTNRLGPRLQKFNRIVLINKILAEAAIPCFRTEAALLFYYESFKAKSDIL